MSKKLVKKVIVFILTWEAKLVLKKYKPKIVGVTGSVGKTSAKDAIYTVLASSFFVRKSEKSFNSEIGIPLTILGMPNAWNSPFKWIKNIVEGFGLILLPNEYPEWLVLEVGADRPGDIQKTAEWVKPDVVVMTRIPDVPVHVEFFESPAAVLREKKYLLEALKEGGALILNADDPATSHLTTPAAKQILTFGFDRSAAVRASNERITRKKHMPAGVSFRGHYGGNSIPIAIEGVLGKQHIYPVLAALAVGLSQGLNLIAMEEALGSHKGPPGRMRLIPGIKGSCIIDDTYNSSPTAVEEALRALNMITTPGRKIVMLGDMMELGRFAVEEHRVVGKRVAGVAELLITVGVRSTYTGKAALSGGRMSKKNVWHCEEAEEAAKKLAVELREGDIVLIKGSQSLRMERAVEILMKEPKKKRELLVRQDVEWEDR